MFNGGFGAQRVDPPEPQVATQSMGYLEVYEVGRMDCDLPSGQALRKPLPAGAVQKQFQRS